MADVIIGNISGTRNWPAFADTETVRLILDGMIDIDFAIKGKKFVLFDSIFSIPKSHAGYHISVSYTV